jgi:hypothetical protein
MLVCVCLYVFVCLCVCVYTPHIAIHTHRNNWMARKISTKSTQNSRPTKKCSKRYAQRTHHITSSSRKLTQRWCSGSSRALTKRKKHTCAVASFALSRGGGNGCWGQCAGEYTRTHARTHAHTHTSRAHTHTCTHASPPFTPSFSLFVLELLTTKDATCPNTCSNTSSKTIHSDSYNSESLQKPLTLIPSTLSHFRTCYRSDVFGESFLCVRAWSCLSARSNLNLIPKPSILNLKPLTLVLSVRAFERRIQGVS